MIYKKGKGVSINYSSGLLPTPRLRQVGGNLEEDPVVPTRFTPHYYVSRNLIHDTFCCNENLTTLFTILEIMIYKKGKGVSINYITSSFHITIVKSLS